jgi:hypothetical protein
VTIGAAKVFWMMQAPPPWDHGVIPALALRWIWGIKKPAVTIGAA